MGRSERFLPTLFFPQRPRRAPRDRARVLRVQVVRESVVLSNLDEIKVGIINIGKCFTRISR